MKAHITRPDVAPATVGCLRGAVYTFAVLLAAVAIGFARDEPSRSAAPKPEPKWIIHEWGTFTSLQDEAGEAIGGINTDDEPVPPFVHRLADFLLLSPTEDPPIFFQGAPRCHPDVTMRLETPVLYFHLPKSQRRVQGIGVEVRFRGGWLTEFYPNADADAPGLKSGDFQFGHLRSNTASTLAWKNVAVGGDALGPQTREHVWTSPRAVQAASVQTAKGENEKFLFYRGVAHINAPLRISRDPKAEQLVFRGQLGPELGANKALRIRSLWLVDIQRDGKVAFRTLPPLTLEENSNKILATISGSFRAADFSLNNFEELKTSLHHALVADGLFHDEAQALLNTWELSYFKSAGLRVFFIVPRPWTDFYLPLKISTPSEINRVMVGRIELVTLGQRHILQQMARFSAAEISEQRMQLQTNFYGKLLANQANVAATPGSKEAEEVDAGRESLATYGVSVPKSYQLYLSLGRFKNALILDEARRLPSIGLTNFVSEYGLAGYQPVAMPSDVSAETANASSLKGSKR